MPLDPTLQPVLDAAAPLAGLPWAQMDAPTVRSMLDAPMQLPFALPPVDARDIAIEADGRTIPARLYRPADGIRPAVLYFHGGGWVVGTLDTHDALCRLLAAASGCAVVSVAYRLAPEHPFPAPLEDCYAAVQGVRAMAAAFGLDGGRIAVAGDSAGGNLAAAVCLLTRDRGGAPLAHQLLLYPVADRDFDNGSYRANGEGYFLTTAMMRWFWNHYVPEGADPPELAAVGRAADLSGLPPATIVTAEYDPLRDEGEALAARLREAGVPVELTRVEGMIHGFASMLGMTPAAEATVRAVAARLRAALGAKTALAGAA